MNKKNFKNTSPFVIFFIFIALSVYSGNPGIEGEIFIRPGKYITGEKDNYDNPQREFVSKGFYMDVHPVTNSMYIEFLSKSGYRAKGGFDKKKAINEPDMPATGLTFKDCVAYAEFYKRRLPTEWEWEIAARSLKKSNLYVRGRASNKHEGNFLNSRIYKKVKVMSYRSNELGLFGMEGNVFEWTSSDYETRLLFGKNIKGTLLKVLRGGSWTNQPVDVKATTRTPFPAEKSLDWIGFRTVRDLVIK